jgi:DNA-binding LytR/AlgR family response regulator
MTCQAISPAPESEPHYLRVVTTKDSTLVFHNLRDAVAELPAEAGLQPHRSYWIATRHLRGLVRHQGKAYLQLTDDSRIPVSRRRLNDVRERVGSSNQPS